MRQAGEPSVEEILDSIKKVIARDNREGAAEQRRQRETVGVAEETVAEIEDDDHEEVLDLAEEAEFEEELEAGGTGDEALVTETAQASMRESLEALAVMAEPGARPQIVRSGETSLEELTRQLLRPALAEWLDRNLPAMVEKMVAAEIARIAGKRG